MSRIQQPDALLIQLLRRSDAPSNEELQRLRHGIMVQLIDEIEASTVSRIVKQTTWTKRFTLFGTWRKDLLLVGTIVGTCIVLAW